MVKDVFLQNGGQHNAFAYISSTNRLRCSIISKIATTQNVILFMSKLCQQAVEVYGQPFSR